MCDKPQASWNILNLGGHPEPAIHVAVETLTPRRNAGSVARASRYVRPERPLVPLTIKTSAGKLNPWSVEYSLRDSTASRCTSAI